MEQIIYRLCKCQQHEYFKKQTNISGGWQMKPEILTMTYLLIYTQSESTIQ